MVYNNFITRFIIGIIFIIIYAAIIFVNYKYLNHLVLTIYTLIILEIFFYFKIKKILTFLYILISLIFFLINNIEQSNIIYFHLMIIIIVTLDIFSYIFGSIFGKIKIISKISPNKTLEGFLGGIIFSLIISLIFVLYFNIKINYILIFFVLVIITSGLIGDLIESYLKRINKLKDSSNFVPGHGGFFDRFDSFVFAMMPYSIITKFIL